MTPRELYNAVHAMHVTHWHELYRDCPEWHQGIDWYTFDLHHLSCAVCAHQLRKDAHMGKKNVLTPAIKAGAEAAAAAEAESFASKSEAKRVAALTVAKAEEAAELAKGKPTQRGMGWIPQRPDQRDKPFPMLTLPSKIPAAYDMRANMPAVFDQGMLGSCTANAALAAVQFTEYEQTGKPRPNMSRLFTYYWSRYLEGHTDADTGATIRDAFKTLNKFGYCLEKLWPYDLDDWDQEPTDEAIAQAAKHKLKTYLDYAFVQPDTGSIKTVVAANNPVVFGFTVYESFMSAYTRKTGKMVYPHKGERVVGGHAVVIVGYDDKTNMFLCRNSWGRSWGLAGYFWMPYDIIRNGLATDFWTVRSVPAPEVVA